MHRTEDHPCRRDIDIGFGKLSTIFGGAASVSVQADGGWKIAARSNVWYGIIMY